MIILVLLLEKTCSYILCRLVVTWHWQQRLSVAHPLAQWLVERGCQLTRGCHLQMEEEASLGMAFEAGRGVTGWCGPQIVPGLGQVLVVVLRARQERGTVRMEDT